MIGATNFFRNSNYLEAVLWIVIGAGFAVAALRGTSRGRWKCCIAAMAFAAFGISDVVEVETGAWWRPWWLFVWKAVCVIVFLWLYVDHRRRRITTPRPPAGDAEEAAPR